MLVLVLQKMMHKRWMVLCLLIGNILLIAVSTSYPMYRTASFKRMLTDEFRTYLEDEGEWPAMVTFSQTRGRSRDGETYEEVLQYVRDINHQLKVPIAREIQLLSTSIVDITPVIEREERVSRQARISAMSDLENQITLYAGRMPQPGIIDGAYLEVIVGEEVADSMDMLLDEVYELEGTAFLNGKPLRVKIVGMFRATNENDPYWVQSVSDLYRDLFVGMDTFLEYFTGEKAERSYGLKKEIYEQWDYEQIEPSQVKEILEVTHRLESDERYFGRLGENSYVGIIENYNAKAKKIEASLLILQAPVLALLLAFLYMLSSQMLSMEQSEISVMKSRGAKGYQILGMYFLQNTIVTAIGLAGGLYLGKVFCELLGTTTDFMEFAGRRTLEVRFHPDVAVYAAAAVLLSFLMTLWPVFRYSKVTIVNLKQTKSAPKASLWKRMGLDVICIGISLYGYFSFAKNQDMVMEQVLTGEALDPLLYLSSSLFLFGFGLLAVRLQPVFLKLIFAIGKRFFKPAAYVALVEGIRGGRRQEFVMLFMVLTVALGIHNTTVARTIVANAEQNATYLNGADVVLREVWKDNSYIKTTDEPLKYVEPDYGRYTVIEGIEQTTKVLRRKVELIRSDKMVTVLGIHTSEFYQVANMQDELLPFAFHEYLNVLATSDTAILVSENFMTMLGYRLGDSLELPADDGGKIRCTIVGFFRYWPSYEPTTYSLNGDGTLKESTQYMVVANLSMLQRAWNAYPYEIWMRVGESTDGLYQFVQENPNLHFTKFRDLDVSKEEIRSDTLFQGTNGILTMSFMVVLLLCGIGYLIYFILSIRSRELLFGVLRAMGMRRGEVAGILLLEQIFCGLYAIVAGGCIGVIGSALFVPMIQNAYAASDQVLPLTLITRQEDLERLFGVIGLVMVVCLFVLIRIVAHLNITKALKLGED